MVYKHWCFQNQLTQERVKLQRMGLSNTGRCLPLMVALSCSVFMVDRSQGATCSPGSQVAPNGNNQCIDIDECNSSPCHVNATCLNTNGSYDCTCNSGFQEPARSAGKRKGLMCEGMFLSLGLVAKDSVQCPSLLALEVDGELPS
ncbi:epidermal growth factor-like protein 6 [Amblyraja radiata]|uniref:epidermal growth factor-like protein 6 n=1 Tax=Amblyraja radiata TaxID=386614 RepID=UPI0014029106|nr:epidermal growth factor-like protein 6 [Amblyraja radiata]